MEPLIIFWIGYQISASFSRGGNLFRRGRDRAIKKSQELSASKIGQKLGTPNKIIGLRQTDSNNMM
jgi:hypothetical protein